jgi:crotonobetainyl-CoA:carnitine CoA-transferase CaiB-like acyl-CoA transferase
MNKAEFYREARTDLTGPLAAVRVLEATTTWAGPMCGAILADLGADVIKVEIPGGEVNRRIPPMLPGTRVSFAHGTVNRNKRSLTLDIRGPEGRDIFLRLAARSDIIVENFKAGTLDSWGLQPTRLEDGSTAPIVGPAAKFSRTPTRVRTAAPALGAHNEEILAELGIDTATRKRLAEAKII